MRVVAAANGGSSADQSIYEYSNVASANALVRAAVYFNTYTVRMDQTGATLVATVDPPFEEPSTRVYDRNWTVRGLIPYTLNDFVVTRDGSRVYVYGDDGKIHVYDLTATPDGVSNQFPQIGSGLTLVGSPESLGAHRVRLVLTPDEHTLFVAGSDQVVVLPLP
jgi:hypothetical protein